MPEWTRIPIPIADELDRRSLCALLTSVGLEVRVVRVRATKSGTPRKFVEYRDSGSYEPKTEA